MPAVGYKLALSLVSLTGNAKREKGLVTRFRRYPASSSQLVRRETAIPGMIPERSLSRFK